MQLTFDLAQGFAGGSIMLVSLLYFFMFLVYSCYNEVSSAMLDQCFHLNVFLIFFFSQCQLLGGDFPYCFLFYKELGILSQQTSSEGSLRNLQICSTAAQVAATAILKKILHPGYIELVFQGLIFSFCPNCFLE